MEKAEGKDLRPDEVREFPKTRLELIKIGGDEEHVLASLEVDATAYLLKDSLPEEFIHLIKEMLKPRHAGGSRLSIQTRLLPTKRRRTSSNTSEIKTSPKAEEQKRKR